jgi:hypothetical protein
MKRALWTLLAMIAPLSALLNCGGGQPPESQNPHPDGPPGQSKDKDGKGAPPGKLSSSDGGPELIVPCGACTYKVPLPYLNGVLNGDAQGVQWPISNIYLELHAPSGAVLATINTLNPSGGSGGTNISQTVSTSVTSGVDKVSFHWTEPNGAQKFHYITVLQR